VLIPVARIRRKCLRVLWDLVAHVLRLHEGQKVLATTFLAPMRSSAARAAHRG